MSSTNRPPTLLLAIVLVSTFAVFAPSLSNGYAMDDRLIAMAHNGGKVSERISRLLPISDYFKRSYWGEQARNDNLYRPVTIYSYALIQHWAGPPELDLADDEQLDVARWQHALNVGLHLLAVILVFALLRLLWVGPGAAIFGALVFGLHAVHSEVVSTVVGRAELFVFVFGALAIVISFGSGKRILRAVSCVPLFFLAFASKENALAWLGFIIVFAIARHQRFRLISARAYDEPAVPPVEFAWIWSLVPALVAAGVYFGLRHQAVGLIAPDDPAYIVNPLAHVDAMTRIQTAAFIWAWKGLGLTILPVGLAADYGDAVFPILDSMMDPRFLVGAAVLITTLVLGLASVRRAPLVFLAATTFLGFSFIVSNVPRHIGTIFGERLYYTPSLAAAFIAAWAAQRAWSRPPARIVVGVLAAAWLGVCALVIVERNPVWQNDDVLFLNEVRVQPNSTRMQLCAATEQGQRKNNQVAMEHLRTAIRLDPEYALAWNNLAAILLERGELGEAEFAARQAIGAEHKSPNASEDLFKIHCNLGLILIRRDQPALAVESFLDSLAEDAKFERAWTEAMQAAQKNQLFPTLRAALDRYRDRIDGARWHLYSAQLTMTVQGPDAAAAAFARALELDEKLTPARIAVLSRAVATGDIAAVDRHVTAGKLHDPTRPEWDILRGRSLEQRGDVGGALDSYLDAVAIARQNDEAATGFVELARRANMVKEATAKLERREAARPAFAPWPYLRGVLLMGVNDPANGTAAFGRALENDPTFVPAWQRLVELADTTRDYRRFHETILTGYAKDRTESAHWSYFNGIAHRTIGRLEEARLLFAEALARDEAFLDARLELLALEWDLAPPRRVRRLIATGAAHHPENRHWTLYQGLLAHRIGDHEGAVRSLLLDLELVKPNAAARLALAASLEKTGRHDDARAVLTAIIQDQGMPEDARAEAAGRLAKLTGK